MIHLKSDTAATAIVNVDTTTNRIATTTGKIPLKSGGISLAKVGAVIIQQDAEAQYEVLYGYFQTLVSYAKRDKETFKNTHV